MKKKLRPIYYLYGAESCLIEEFLSDVKSSALTPGFESMNYHIYYGDTLNLADALMTVKTMPAFSDKRLVIIKKASSLKIDSKRAMLDYLLNPSPSSILVFVSTSAKLGKEDAFLKAIKKNGVIKAFRPPRNESEGMEWLVGEAAKEGKTITVEARRNLIALTGGSLTALKGELSKIILFVGDKKEIETSDVSEAGLDVKEESIFALTDAIGERNLKSAFAVYAKLSAVPSLMIIGAIARHMRILIKLKSAIRDGHPRNKLPSLAGVSPYFFEGYNKNCRLFTVDELKRAMKFLFETNMSLKGSGLPEKLIMTNMIMHLCAP